MATLDFRVFDTQGNKVDGDYTFTVDGSSAQGIDYDGRFLICITNTHLAYCNYEPGVGVTVTRQFEILSGLNSNMFSLTGICTDGVGHWVSASQNIFRDMSATRTSQIYRIDTEGNKLLQLPNYSIGALGTPGHNDLTFDGKYVYATHQSTSVAMIGGGFNTTYSLRKFYPHDGRSIIQSSAQNTAGVKYITYTGHSDQFYAVNEVNDLLLIRRNQLLIENYGSINSPVAICTIGSNAGQQGYYDDDFAGYEGSRLHGNHIGTIR